MQQKDARSGRGAGAGAVKRQKREVQKRGVQRPSPSEPGPAEAAAALAAAAQEDKEALYEAERLLTIYDARRMMREPFPRHPTGSKRSSSGGDDAGPAAAQASLPSFAAGARAAHKSMPDLRTTERLTSDEEEDDDGLPTDSEDDTVAKAGKKFMAEQAGGGGGGKGSSRRRDLPLLTTLMRSMGTL